VELISVLEDRFQIDVDEQTFTEARTVGDLEKLIHGPARSQECFHYPRWAQKPPVTWLRKFAYYLLVWPATFLLAYPQVRGRENLRGQMGPMLFVSNHITQVDIGFILAALPTRFRHRIAVAMNGEMLEEMRNPPEALGFRRRLGKRLSYWSVVALFNVFPLPQRGGFRESFSFAGESMDRGWSVLVFPEGKRTRDGKIDVFRTGIGILAADLDAMVVPMRIDGLFELKMKNRRIAWPGKVRVGIGAAVKYEGHAEPVGIAFDLQTRVKTL